MNDSMRAATLLFTAAKSTRSAGALSSGSYSLAEVDGRLATCLEQQHRGAMITGRPLVRTVGIAFWVLAGALLFNAVASGRALAAHKITISFAGSGGGSVTVVDTTDPTNNVTCVSTCTVSVGNNDVGTLAATATGGSSFVGWSTQSVGISGCVGNSCTFNMGGN